MKTTALLFGLALTLAACKKESTPPAATPDAPATPAEQPAAEPEEAAPAAEDGTAADAETPADGEEAAPAPAPAPKADTGKEGPARETGTTSDGQTTTSHTVGGRRGGPTVTETWRSGLQIPPGEFENAKPLAPEDYEISEAAPPKGIVPSDAGDSWEIRPWRVERWKDNPYRLGNAEKHGEGWKLKSVRKGSPGWWIGLRNGDVIYEVNDKQINTMPKLIAAYIKLKNQTVFDVKIERAGEKRTHHYEIVEGTDQ